MSMPVRFAFALRVLHWLMALMILAMLFIGAGMMSTADDARRWLFDLHKPLGVAILLLAAARLIVRLITGAPPLPDDLPTIQKHAAHVSHIVLYVLMFALPLLGWATLSAGGYPVSLFGALVLPPILPQNLALYGWLHLAHISLALVLFAVVLGHLGAALVHGLLRRDGVFSAMASWRLGRRD
ncbi:cytochrome b [Dyella sp.]|uniref:cytochrome b n=1 Tax=Dyella sp. TaxID=1869338 RepID=UPI002ED05E2C